MTHRVIAMVVLRCQAEDGKRPAFVFRRLVAVVVTEHAPDRELATLDPDRGGLIDGLEEHGAALSGEESVNVVLLEKHVDQRVERTSAQETTVRGSSGSATGRASAFSLRCKRMVNTAFL